MKINPLLSLFIVQNQSFKDYFRIMRITLFLLFACVFQLLAMDTEAQNSIITFSSNSISVGQLIEEIEKQTDYLVVYSNREIDINHQVTIRDKSAKVSSYLKEALAGTGISYKFENDYIILSKSNSLLNQLQQQEKITGTVTDEKGVPIIGANIMEKGTSNGAITDINGNFTLSVSENARLQISYIGYISQEITVKGRNKITIVLSDDTQVLNEVVVVGYGTQKKKSLTGAISSVKSTDIVNSKNENLQNMLTGKVAGLRIVQNTSEPGDFNNSMDIRGLGAPLVIIDGVPRSNMARIDANDIENVTVLKDASAAVYGVRAANGVVLITTKKGVKEKTELNYSGSFSLQMPSGMPKSTDAIGYMTLINENTMHNANGGKLTYMDEDFTPYLDGTAQSTDWYSAVIRDCAPQTQHSLSATGGNEKTQYYISVGYSYQEGLLKGGDLNYEKYNVRSNVTSKITNRIKVDFNLSGIMDEKNNSYLGTGGAFGVYKSVWRQIPLQPIYANNNPNYIYDTKLESANSGNPVALIDKDVNGYTKYRKKWFQSSASITYDVPYIEGLQLKGLFSYDYNLSDNKLFKKQYNQYTYDEETDTYIPYAKQNPSSVRRENHSSDISLYQVSLNYDHNFKGDHDVSALLLFEQSVRNGDNFYALRELAIPIDQLMAGNATNQVGNMNTDGLYKDANQGLIGRVNYAYKSKYFAEFSFRYDGSSKFPKDSRWALFPAGSIGWRVSEENFWKQSRLSFIDNFKLRLSYGKMGDDASARYQFLMGYTYPATGANNGLPGGYLFDGTFVNSSVSRGIPNPNITWYTAKMLNVGFDMSAWNGLLGVTMEYFQRNRDGLLATRTASLPDIVGASLPQENLNSDLTRGFEMELTHFNRVGDFTYNVKGNLSFTRTMNKYQETARKGNSYENYRNNQNDRWSNIWWGYGTNGRYQSYGDVVNSGIFTSRDVLPGDYRYEDWNGDGIISELDIHPIEKSTSSMPLMNFGFTLSASYKGFDLSTLFQGAAMRHIAYQELLAQPVWYNSNSLTQFLDRWHPVDSKANPYDPNTEWIKGKYAYTGTNPEHNSKFNMHNATYLRLKTIELGYTLPTALTQKVGVRSARLYINGYNLFTFSQMKYVDPEHTADQWGYLYPMNKTVSFGVNIGF